MVRPASVTDLTPGLAELARERPFAIPIGSTSAGPMRPPGSSGGERPSSAWEKPSHAQGSASAAVRRPTGVCLDSGRPASLRRRLRSGGVSTPGRRFAGLSAKPCVSRVAAPNVLRAASTGGGSPGSRGGPAAGAEGACPGAGGTARAASSRGACNPLARAAGPGADAARRGARRAGRRLERHAGATPAAGCDVVPARSLTGRGLPLHLLAFRGIDEPSGSRSRHRSGSRPFVPGTRRTGARPDALTRNGTTRGYGKDATLHAGSEPDRASSAATAAAYRQVRPGVRHL